MSDTLNRVYQSVDEANAEQPAATRRQLVAGAAATIGGLGLLGVPGAALAGGGAAGVNTPENITNIAATAEVLATIVNTVGGEEVDLDDVTLRNVRAAAREELIHYNVLVSPGFGGSPLTKRIWVPDTVFANATNFLSALEVGDQIFINAYLIATTVFGNAGNGTVARYAAEFMGAEAVHRALARQSLGKLGNDRAFMKYSFNKITTAVSLLQGAGFGFGERGATPGQFYNFNQVSQRTPNPSGVNTRAPQ